MDDDKEDSGSLSATFVMKNEDHTLANALRNVIVNYTDVEFCGYSMPHPSEAKVHFRIQSTERSAIDILKAGLLDLKKMANELLRNFETELKAFNNKLS